MPTTTWAMLSKSKTSREAIEAYNKAVSIKPEMLMPIIIQALPQEQGKLEQAEATTKPSPLSLIMLMPITTSAMFSKGKAN